MFFPNTVEARGTLVGLIGNVVLGIGRNFCLAEHCQIC